MYQRLQDGRVKRLTDNAIIPRDPTLHDWREVQRWIGDGNELAPVPQPSLDESKAQAWERIKAERDRRKLEGGFKVGAHWFHSDLSSRIQQLGLVALGANLPAGEKWKTMSGDKVTLTQTLAQQILGSGAATDSALFKAAEAHKAAMEASDDPAAYDYSGGWPETFTG